MTENKSMAAEKSDTQLRQELDGLKNDYAKLRDTKVRAEADLKNWTERLEELEEQALKEYGTSDPEKLQALLAEKQAENSRLVAEYREHLQGVQQALAELEEDK